MIDTIDKLYNAMFKSWYTYVANKLLVLDATGKLPDGMIGGNFNALGSYQSCLDIEANPKDSPSFSGKYGPATFYGRGIGAIIKTHLLYGVCLPDSCTDQDFRRILYTIDSQMGESNHFIWIPYLSAGNKSYNLSGGDIVMM